MDCLILMAESLCRVDKEVSLHLTVPAAPASVRAWAERRPEVILTTVRPEGVAGWYVKPSLLLQELDEGWPAAVWLDTDMIVTHPISRMLEQFPSDYLIVAQEWAVGEAIPMSPFWGSPLERSVPWINACFIRATQAHRPLLERYLEMSNDPRFIKVQTLPYVRRPHPLRGDTPLMIALLQSAEFAHVPYDYLRLGRDIAQCAGSSGYRPHHRMLDLFRGLPPLIHCVGHKPWKSRQDGGRIHQYLLNLADDLSPYVLAAHGIATDLHMAPEWLDARTSLGAMLRRLTAYHPAMAGLPLATLQSLQLGIGQMVRFSKRNED